MRTIADARSMGVTVLPPDINESDTDFKVVYTNPAADKKVSRKDRVRDALGPQIRFGLGAVRGVGGAALEALFEARGAGGPFGDLFDFASRVDAKKLNKAVFEALVQCGAFDQTLAKQGVSRARAFASLDVALERSRAASRDRERGQTNLFGLFDAAAPEGGPPAAGDFAECPPWDRKEMLVRERQSLGFYVSGHPLERYLKGGASLARLDAVATTDCAGQDDWAVVKLVGMVEGYRERIFKDGGGKVAFFEIEDLVGRVNVKVRGNQIETYAHVLTAGEPILVTGKVSFPRRDDDAPDEDTEVPREPTILLNDAVLLADAVARDTRQLVLRLSASQVQRGQLEKVRDVLRSARGECPVSLYLTLPDGAEALFAFGSEFRVEVGDPVLSGLERIFGAQVAELR